MASSFSKSDNCGGKSVTKSRFKETNTKRRPNKKKDSKNRVSNIVCISPISNFKEKVSEAKNLLWSLNQVIITAVGPSIPHAINLAMILQSTNAVAIETSTSTVHHSGTDYFNQKEFSSPSIRIRVDLLGEKK